jgi:CHRD domain
MSSLNLSRGRRLYMRRLLLVVLAAFAVAALSVGGATGKNGPSKKNGHGVSCVLHSKLTAKAETTSSTSVAKGHTLIKVRANGTIEFKTRILNKAHETFVAGHIHLAPAGVAGPVVVPLFVAPTPVTSARHIKQSGIATPNPGTTGAALCADPAAYYVNYHTTAFPGGAIRGQLH